MAVRLAFPSILVAMFLIACGGGDDAGSDGGGGGGDGGGGTIDASNVDAPPPPDAQQPDATPVEYDCNALPLGDNGCTGQHSEDNTCFLPVDVSNAIASEDLAFDADGNLVGSDNSTIWKTSYTGQPQLFVPNIDFRAGIQFIPNGDLIVANNDTNSLMRIEPDGTQHVVLSGLQYPNGVAVDDQGYVYVTEHDAGQVRRIDPLTGEFTIIVTPQDGIGSPNGIAFNAAYDRLYIAGFDGDDTIYTLTIDDQGTPGTVEVFASNVGSGWLDGIGVDACGNVYICDYGYDGDTDIIRFSSDGSERVMIMRGIPGGGQGQSRYVPNIRWGSGIGGWSPTTIYMPDGWRQNVMAIDLGVPSATQPYP